MDNKKVVFLTGTRADFGKLKSLITILDQSEQFDVHIFATGMHMDARFGKTVDEVLKCGFRNVFQFINHDDVCHMDRVLGKTIDGLSHFAAEEQPDIIVVHGDRPEALAGAIVGSFNNRLVVHIEGGELSGTIDDSIRHAISKLAHVHMVANEEARKRLLQLGEKEDAIHIIGSPDLDLMNPQHLPDIDHVKGYYDIDFEHYGIVMFHPVTTDVSRMPQHARRFFNALKKSPLNYVVIYPNNDLGSDVILREIEQLQGNERFRIFPSLRFEYFLRLLQQANFIIGNSSAGIREAPFYKTPTINVGDRQQRRSLNPAIINCDYEESSVCQALERIRVGDIPSQNQLHDFGQGDSDERFLAILQALDLESLSRQKVFQEMDL